MKIPPEVIDQIRNYDIVSILEDEGLKLKREGADYKCCCPFHSEKTPSFVVSPSRNIAHCFGACNDSWDAISFVQRKNNMTFPEAVEYLADKLHIRYEKREPTPEEREAQYRKEKLVNANRAALAYFRDCMDRAPVARQYCEKRGWSEETVKTFSIGYAPPGNGLVKTLTEKGWKREALVDAGLAGLSEDGRYYDVFRDRIIFPLHDRTGALVGFTGRYIGNREDVLKQMKYLNSRETEIYRKKEILFGWYQAARQVSVTGTVVMVEGNPDVIRLHQIGVENAIAPCGTSLTEEHIRFLKDRSKTVIIAGDMDKSGIEASGKHGLDFVKAGFTVRLMTWDYDKNDPHSPKDPDEYFLKRPKGWAEALSRNTSDFIPWYCARVMNGRSTQSDIAAGIEDVAKLLSYCKDATAVDMYLEAFTKEYKYGKVWRSSYFKAKNEAERAQVEKDSKSQDMLRQYGFYVKNHCYYGAGSSSGDRPWSNFVMEPVLHIRDEKNARRIFRVINEAGVEEVVKFQQSELVSFADFKRILESAGNYVWKVSAAEMTQLKTYLYEDTPSADEIRQLGWQKRWGFYAWGNGGMEGDKFVKADRFGIFQINGRRFYLPGCAADTASNTGGYQTERKFTYQETNDITLRDYAQMLIGVYGDNAKVALCFLLASLFRDIVSAVTNSFPILNLFGPKGTGKTELGQSLTAFFFSDYTAPSLAGTTKAAIAESVAEVSNAIVHLDEYKWALPADKQEILKGLWNGVGRSRVNVDNGMRKETTAVDCGVIISGQESPTADIALFSRVIHLAFHKTTFSIEEKQRFSNLKRIEKRGLTHLTAQLLSLRGEMTGNFRKNWEETLSEMASAVRQHAVEDRTLYNWTVLLSVFRTLESRLALPFDYKECFRLCSQGCIDQNAKTRQSNELAGFWETVENMVVSSKAWIEIDYRIIRGGRTIKTQESKKAGTGGVELNPHRRFLLVNFNRMSSLYLKEGKDALHTIPKDSLKYYLENSPEYVGTALSVKFKQPDNQLGYTPTDNALAKTRTSTAMIFDYDAVSDNYSVSLDLGTGYVDREALEDIAAAAASPVPPAAESGEDQDMPLF